MVGLMGVAVCVVPPSRVIAFRVTGGFLLPQMELADLFCVRKLFVEQEIYIADINIYERFISPERFMLFGL